MIKRSPLFNLDKYLLEICSLHRSATASRGIGAEEFEREKNAHFSLNS